MILIHISEPCLITVNIAVSNAPGVSIIIYDDSGKTAYKNDYVSANDLQNLNLSSLKPGNYTGIATSGTNKYHFKFTKM